MQPPERWHEGERGAPGEPRSSSGHVLGRALLLSPRAAAQGVSTQKNYRQLQKHEVNVRLQPCLLWGTGMRAGRPSWEP